MLANQLIRPDTGNVPHTVRHLATGHYPSGLIQSEYHMAANEGLDM
ncbi:MAG: hypothetical protein ABR568_04730 [Pyrinomonadaceae bacterium]